MRIEVSPPPPSRSYLRHLRSCFPAWEGARAARWFFERRVGGPAADLLTVRDGRRMVAGVALTYRTMRLANDALILAATMTAGWTLPAVRRQGILTRLAYTTPGVAGRRGAALVLGFVRADNPSRAALVTAGYEEWPTRYLTDGTPSAALETAGRWRSTPAAEATVGELFRLHALQGAGAVRPAYPDRRVFSSQFLERPRPCELLRLEGDDGEIHAWAVLEAAEQTDRLQLLLTPPARRAECTAALRQLAAARERRFFAYDSGSSLDETWRELGLAVIPGRILVKAADEALLAAALGLGSGRPGPPAGASLLDPSSPWYLGPWRLESGDRM